MQRNYKTEYHMIHDIWHDAQKLNFRETVRLNYDSVCKYMIDKARELFFSDSDTEFKGIGNPDEFYDFVMNDLSRVFKIDRKQIESEKRVHDFVAVRNIAFFFLYFNRIRLTKIGQLCGNRDHTTVIHGKNNVLRKLEVKDERFCNMWNLYISIGDRRIVGKFKVRELKEPVIEVQALIRPIAEY